MPEGKRRSPMLVPTVVMGVIAIALVLLARSRGTEVLSTGMRSSAKTLVSVLPLLVFAFVVAGMIQVLLPVELVARWIGDESSLRGIMLGTLAGAWRPGGRT